MEQSREALKKVRTRDQAIAWTRDNVAFGDMAVDQDVEESVDWFVATVNARMVFDSYQTKDLASLFLDGQVGIKQDPDGQHEAFWLSFFEDADLARSDGEVEEADGREDEAIDDILTLMEYHYDDLLNLQ